jgi:glycosyltransferase involved in cell wall biosynthesis
VLNDASPGGDLKPLRILHVVETLDPATGGPPVAALKLASAQAQQGHDVHMLSYRIDGAAENIQKLLDELPDSRLVHQHLLPPPSLGERLTGNAVAAAAPAILAGMDVAHLHGVWAPILLRAAREARRLGVAYVVAPHGMLHQQNLSQGRLKKRIGLWLNRRMLDNAAFMHALNAQERLVIERQRLASPIEEFANGMFEYEIATLPSRGAFRARHPDIAKGPYVLFLSRLHKKKGTDYLAEAFSILARMRPDVRLVVVGPDGGAGEAMIRRVRECGLTRRVHFMGPLYGQDKKEAIVDADVFCLPSREEGHSIAILEALGAGIPCVVTRTCYFPEVETAGAGFVVDADAGAIADALLKAVDDKMAWQRMSMAGRDLVLQNFTWPLMARRACEAYRRHLRRGRRNSAGEASPLPRLARP